MGRQAAANCGGSLSPVPSLEPLGIGANGEDPTISRHANRLAYVEADLRYRHLED